jgi:phenylacetate-CoA ligase
MHAVAEWLYDHSPVLVQNLLTNLYGLKVYRQRYGGAFSEYRTLLAQYEALPREEQDRIQLTRLRDLVAYAIEKSPFYRRLYGDLDAGDIKTLEDLRALPLVTKDMLRENIDAVITIPSQKAAVWHTGGTTGKSLVGYATRENAQERMATLAHFKAKHGFVHGKMRRATFNGKHIVPPGYKGNVFWRSNLSIRQRIYSSFHLTQDNLPLYIEDIRRFRPHSLDGFPSSILEVAGYIERHGLSLGYTPVAVFPTSETVTPEVRATIERAFGCPVRDQYASSEGAPFVTECPLGQLHYDTFSGIIEPREQGSPEILVTSFTSYGTPLIRYAIGDAMEFAPPDEICDCGNNTPLVRSIQGRSSDYLVRADGGKVIAANLANVLKNLPNSVIRTQFVQDRLGEVIVKLVVDRDRFESAQAQRLLDELAHKFGRGTEFVLYLVDDIPREASGKHRLVKNMIGDSTHV